MTILSIVQVGHPVLREKAKPLSREEILSDRIQTLIKDMQETMYDAPGVGLAAPQIGESIQLVVIEDREIFLKTLPSAFLKERDRKPVPFHVIINPTITLIEPEKTAAFYEGCLSFSPFLGMVPRALSVKVSCLNEKAEPINIVAKGWYARILQHECDHLQGYLCVDRMRLETLSTAENYSKYWLKPPSA